MKQLEGKVDMTGVPPELAEPRAARLAYDKTARRTRHSNLPSKSKGTGNKDKSQELLLAPCYLLLVLFRRLIHLSKAPIDLRDRLTIDLPNLVRRCFQLALQFGLREAE